MFLYLNNMIFLILEILKPSIPSIILGIHGIQMVFEPTEITKEENFFITVVNSITRSNDVKNNLEKSKDFFFVASSIDDKFFSFEIFARSIGLGFFGVGISIIFRGLIEVLFKNLKIKNVIFNFIIFGFVLIKIIDLFIFLMKIEIFRYILQIKNIEIIFVILLKKIFKNITKIKLIFLASVKYNFIKNIILVSSITNCLFSYIAMFNTRIH